MDNDNTIWIIVSGGKVIAYQNGAWKTSFNDSYSLINTESLNSYESINLGNVPNPFNITTTIEYTLHQDSYTIMTIYNISGQVVDTLKDEYQHSGKYSISWNAANMPSGIYFCTLKANNVTYTEKMLLIK